MWKDKAADLVTDTVKEHVSGAIGIMHAVKILIYVIAMAIVAGVTYLIAG